MNATKSDMGTESGVLLIADDGVTEYRIVIPESASPSERRGAEELQRFLEQMSGARLPISTDEGRIGEKEIILGDNAHLRAIDIWIDFEDLGDEGFVIRTVTPHLVIAGGSKRGTMYGVYAFLEEHLGCRWFTSKLSHIPVREHLAIGHIDDA